MPKRDVTFAELTRQFGSFNPDETVGQTGTGGETIALFVLTCHAVVFDDVIFIYIETVKGSEHVGLRATD